MRSGRAGLETVGGGGGESRERKYGCHAKARAVENGGRPKEGGRKEGWRVAMMDVLLSFRAP